MSTPITKASPNDATVDACCHKAEGSPTKHQCAPLLKQAKSKKQARIDLVFISAVFLWNLMGSDSRREGGCVGALHRNL